MMRRIAFWGFIVVAVAACDGPTAGDLFLDLGTPNDDDGAIEFAVRADDGREIQGAAPECRRCRIFTTTLSTQELRGVVTGDIRNGPFLRLKVSDVGRPAAYTFTFVSAASRTFDVRASVAGYTVTVRR